MKSENPVENATVEIPAGYVEDLNGSSHEGHTPPAAYKIGFLRIPHYRSTYFQVFLAGVVNLLAVGKKIWQYTMNPN